MRTEFGEAVINIHVEPEGAAQADAVAKDLAASRTSLVVTGWLALVLGLLAAGAAWWGISIRLGEYR